MKQTQYKNQVYKKYLFKGFQKTFGCWLATVKIKKKLKRKKIRTKIILHWCEWIKLLQMRQ